MSCWFTKMSMAGDCILVAELYWKRIEEIVGCGIGQMALSISSQVEDYEKNGLMLNKRCDAS